MPRPREMRGMMAMDIQPAREEGEGGHKGAHTPSNASPRRMGPVFHGFLASVGLMLRRLPSRGREAL